MNRIVSRLLIAVGVVGVGAAAVHFGGRYYAATQVEKAIGQLERAGVDVRYAALDISGVIMPERGAVREIEITIPSLGWRFAVPEAVSDVSFDTLDRFSFELPEEIEITLLDPAGAPTGDMLRLTGSDMRAELAATEENVYDFALRAEEIEVSFDGVADAEIDTMVFVELLAETRVEIDPAVESLAATITFDLAEYVVREPGDAAVMLAEMYDIRGGATADGTRMRIEAAVGSTSISPKVAVGSDDGEATLERLDIALEVTAAERIDYGLLFDAPAGGDVFEALGQVAANAVRQGGAARQEISIGLLSMSAPHGAETDATIALIEVAEARYAVAAEPQSASFDIEVGALRAEGIDDAFFLSAQEVAAAVAIRQNEGVFDYAAVTAPMAAQETPPEAADLFTGPFDVSGSYRHGAMAFRAAPSLGADDATLAGFESDAASIEFNLGSAPPMYRVAADVAALRLQFGGANAGALDIDAAAVSLDTRLIPDAEDASAALAIEIVGAVIDPTIWAQIDPAGRLEPTIERIDVTATLEAAAAAEAPTLMGEPSRIDLTFEARMFGMTASGGGVWIAAPESDADAITIRLENWRDVADVFSQAPLFRGGEAAAMILALQSIIVDFGTEGGAPGVTVFEIATEDGVLTVNGAPFGSLAD